MEAKGITPEFSWDVEMKYDPEERNQQDQVEDDDDFGGSKICIDAKVMSAQFKKQAFNEDQSKSDAKSDGLSENKDNIKESYDTVSKNDEIPWLSIRTSVDDAWLQLHNEIIEFYKMYGPSKQSDKIRKKLYLKAKKQIKSFMPESTIKMFGSTAAKLYLPRSDIDVVVFLPRKNSSDMKNSKKLHKQISKVDWVRSCEQIGAKVPIVKLEDKETGLFMDISFSKANGVAALLFIKKYLVLYPELKYLLMVVKAFLKARDLNETFYGGMSSFICTLMVISYLQEVKKSNKMKSLLLSEHLVNFFHLYGVKFNYNELGISIRNGGAYFLRKDRDWLPQNKSKPVTLCIENPQDPTIDLGKGVFNMTQIHTAFQHAYDVLLYNSSTGPSILASIMGDISNLK